MNFASALNHLFFGELRNLSARNNLEVYVVGGFVRDLLMGNPGKDIDVVTVGSGISLARSFASLDESRKVIVYENFGTAVVKAGDYEIEFIGARKESYRKNSRKPIVETGTLAEDQLRRDFTINSLYISLGDQDFGELHDPFGGVEDLQSKIIRTSAPPEVTFSDDPLRMMRAIRFATVLDFSIEEKTLRAIQSQAERIRIVSAERITSELNKIILSDRPAKGFKLLFNTGLLEIIFPEFHKLQGVQVIKGKAHKDNFYHTLQVLENLCRYTDNLWLRWAAILHDIAKPQTAQFDPLMGWSFHGHEDKGARMVPGIFSRLRLPMNEHMKYVQKLVRLHLRPIALADSEVTDSAIRRLIVEAGEDLDDLLQLCRADITTRDQKKVEKYLRNFDVVEQKIHEVLERDNLRNWQPPVTGQMIMDYFGLKPGPEVGRIKTAVREAILDGIIPNDYEAAIEWMKKTGKEILTEESKTD